MEDQYKALVDDLANGRIAFDVGNHGADHGLLEAMASWTYKSFKVIPGAILTQSLIEIGAKSLCEMMGEEQCYTPGSYEATALNLIEKSISLHSFHHDLLTKKIIDACLELSPWDTIERRNRIGSTGRALITAEGLNSAVQVRIDILGLLEPWEVSQISDEALEKAIRNHPTQGMMLDKVGRRDVLIREISKGLWCTILTTTKSGNIKIAGLPRPASLPNAISARMKTDERNATDILYYDCFAAGFPVEAFKNLVRSKARKDWILGIFPAEDLIRAFKDDMGMKGKILEHGLGM